MIARKVGSSIHTSLGNSSANASESSNSDGNNNNSGSHIDNLFFNKRKMSLRRSSFKKESDSQTEMNHADMSATSRNRESSGASRTVIIRNGQHSASKLVSSRLIESQIKPVGPSATVSDLYNRLTPSSSSSNKVTRRRRGSREVIEYEPTADMYDLSFVSTQRAATPSSIHRNSKLSQRQHLNTNRSTNLLPPTTPLTNKNKTTHKQYSVDSESNYVPSKNNEAGFHVIRRTQTAYNNESLRRLLSSPLQLRRNASLKIDSNGANSSSSKRITESVKYFESKSVINANKLRRSKEINLSLDSHIVNASDSKQTESHYKKSTAASIDSERSTQNNPLDSNETGENMKIPLGLIGDNKIRLNLQERSKTSLERDYQTSNQLILGTRRTLSRQMTTSSLKNTSSNEDSGDSGFGTVVDYENSKIQLKNNIQSSFLTYGSTVMNPFGSNFDIVSKDNPTFYKSISSTNGSSDFLNRRFNRANANPNLMNMINQFRSVNLANDKINEEDPNAHHAKKPPTSDNAHAGKPSDATKTADKETSAKSLNAFNTVRMTDLNWTSNVHNSPEANFANRAMSSNDSIISNNQAAVKQNFFLNYRQLTDLKKDESENVREPARLESSQRETLAEHKAAPSASGGKKLVHSKSAAPAPTSRSINRKNNDTSDHLAEHRLNNGPENFLEAHKILRIQNWIEEVERVQRVEGKWRDVINVITFYD